MPSVSESLKSAVRFHESGDFATAEQLYREILRLDSELDQRPYVHFNLARILKEQDDLANAAEQYLQGLKFLPTEESAIYELGEAFYDLGLIDEAILTLERLLKINPRLVKGQAKLAKAYHDRKDYADAAECYRRAIQFNPNIASLYNNLGTVLKDQEKFHEAITCFDQSLNIQPIFAEALCNKGAIYAAQLDFQRAIECYNSAIEVEPSIPAIYRNRGNAQKSLGQFNDALESYHSALTIDPSDAEAHFNQSLVWLTKGEFEQGWPKYEWRWQQLQKRRVGCGCQQWDGSDLSGRTILVYTEQGVGDEIMFASCIPEVIDQAGSCIIACDPRLVGLFTRSFPSAHVFGIPISKDPNARKQLQSVDVELAVGSLPKFLRRNRRSFKPPKNYITADSHLKEKWKAQLADLGSDLKVGISWRGGKDPHFRNLKSIPLEQWTPLLELPGISFINLQYDDSQNELSAIRDLTSTIFYDWPNLDRMNDFENLAALISELDLVISVSNTTVHLAGALGAPTWTLLPFASDWRWFLDCEESLWYPEMKLFRQPTPGNWEHVLNRVSVLLKEMLNQTCGNEK